MRKAFPQSVWRMKTSKPSVYLTFDDGPIPNVTEWVLDVLKQKGVKATFFCVGKNVQENESIYKRILAEGHVCANHTFHHVKGWITDNKAYYTDILNCKEYYSNNLFRPPYGKIKPSQYNKLKTKYKIIMWDVLSYDYDAAVSPEVCLKNVTKYTRKGSIIVFHDSIKAERNLKYALPLAIDYLMEKGFNFEVLK